MTILKTVSHESRINNHNDALHIVCTINFVFVPVTDIFYSRVLDLFIMTLKNKELV